MAKPKYTKEQIIVEKMPIWYKHPEVFFKEVLDQELTPNQIDMLKLFIEEPMTTIKGSNACGKSHLIGLFIPWYFLFNTSYLGLSTIILLTAPSYKQVVNGTYNLTKKWVKKANERLQEWTGDKKWKMFDKEFSEDANRCQYRIDADSFIIGLAATNDPNSIQGIGHAQRKLIIMDEMQSVPDSTIDAFNGIQSSGVTTIIGIGNTSCPEGKQGRFYESFNEDSVYANYTITAFDTPNFIMSDIKFEDYLKEENDKGYWVNKVDRFAKTNRKYYLKHHSRKKWQEDVLKSFGQFDSMQNPISVYNILAKAGFNREDPEVKIRVFAEFPEENNSAVFPLKWIQRSIASYKDQSKWLPGVVSIGIDFGRGVGQDKTSFAVVNGNKLIYLKEFDLKPDEISEKIEQLYYQFNADIIKIEKNAEGYVYENILQGKGLPVYAVDVGSAVGFPKTNNYDLKKYTQNMKSIVNLKRDEIYWNLRNKLDPISNENDDEMFLIMPDTELERQMRSITFSYNSKGQVVVSKKDEIRARIKRSPDKLDSLLIAIAPDDYKKTVDINTQHFKWIQIKK